MVITINLAKVVCAVVKILMLFVMEFLGLGFVKIILDTQSKAWERILGVIEIVLILSIMFLMFY